MSNEPDGGAGASVYRSDCLPLTSDLSTDHPEESRGLCATIRHSTSPKETTLAREKNTSRAEARRRTRAELRAELAALDAAEAEELEDEAEDEATDAAPRERKPIFRMPNVRADLRDVPQMFRERRLLWLPVILGLIGFVLVLTLFGLPADLQPIALTYIQVFFVPQGLLTFFAAGFLAPRASYLAGAMVGTMNGFLLAIGLLLTAPSGTPVTPTDVVAGISSYTLTGLLFGAIAGWFAGWYRDFLRGMQSRSRSSRGNKEQDERAKRREQRQEARKIAKRPSS